MIHPVLPMTLVSVLFGIGLYGVLARRNAVLMLIGVELMLATVGLLFITVGSLTSDLLRAGQVFTTFVITIAAAEIAVAVAMILAVYRACGNIDLTRVGKDD